MTEILAAAAQSGIGSPAFAKALAIGIGSIMPAFGIGWIGSSAMKAIGRNPEVAGRILPVLLIAAALVEAIAIYVLVVVFTIS